MSATYGDAGVEVNPIDAFSPRSLFEQLSPMQRFDRVYGGLVPMPPGY